jgi:uncharacterized membrane protein YiaA
VRSETERPNAGGGRRAYLWGIMSGIALLAGTALILAGLWNRDRERLALGLFVAGAVLVVAAGVLAVPALTAP